MTFWANLLGYEAVWCASVYGAGHGRWWLGPALLLPFALWQIGVSRWPRADAALVLGAALLGFGVDSIFALSGSLRYASPLPAPELAPIWIVGVWMAFALTLNHSLAFLKQHAMVAVALGAIGGPLAYWFAGASWGAVQFAAPAWRALLGLALAWAALVPALAWIARHLVQRFPDAMA